MTEPDLRFNCDRCGQHLSASTDMAGDKVSCPACGTEVTVPAREDPGSIDDALTGGPRPSQKPADAGADELDGLQTDGGHRVPPHQRFPDADDPLPDMIAARYKVGRRLGAGGFGAVYEAYDTQLKRRVAIKRLHAGTGDDPGVREAILRFRREAQSIAALPTHPNLISVFDSGQDELGDYIVMELADGGSLKQLLASKGRFAPAEAIQLILEVAEGLAHAHRHNLVHRDIKPANILLQPDRDRLVPKIVDFGLAREGRESEFSASGTSMGTPVYMPPEQRTDAKNVNHTADIYALGKTLYHMVTGDVPYDIDSSRIPPVPGLAQVIAKCTRTDPAARYFSVDEVIAALRGLSADSRPKPPTPPAPPPAPVATARSPGPWIAVIVILFLAGAAAAFLYVSRPQQPSRPGATRAPDAPTAVTLESTPPGAAEPKAATPPPAAPATGTSKLTTPSAPTPPPATPAVPTPDPEAQARAQYASAMEDVTRAMADDLNLLQSHGGPMWVKLQEQIRTGHASSADPLAGAKAFNIALGMLPSAVAEAKERKIAAERPAAAVPAPAATAPVRADMVPQRRPDQAADPDAASRLQAAAAALRDPMNPTVLASLARHVDGVPNFNEKHAWIAAVALGQAAQSGSLNGLPAARARIAQEDASSPYAAMLNSSDYYTKCWTCDGTGVKTTGGSFGNSTPCVQCGGKGYISFRYQNNRPPCPRCKGTGRDPGGGTAAAKPATTPCDRCGGKGGTIQVDRLREKYLRVLDELQRPDRFNRGV